MPAVFDRSFDLPESLVLVSYFASQKQVLVQVIVILHLSWF